MVPHAFPTVCDGQEPAGRTNRGPGTPRRAGVTRDVQAHLLGVEHLGRDLLAGGCDALGLLLPERLRRVLDRVEEHNRNDRLGDLRARRPGLGEGLPIQQLSCARHTTVSIETLTMSRAQSCATSSVQDQRWSVGGARGVGCRGRRAGGRTSVERISWNLYMAVGKPNASAYLFMSSGLDSCGGKHAQQRPGLAWVDPGRTKCSALCKPPVSRVAATSARRPWRQPRHQRGRVRMRPSSLGSRRCGSSQRAAENRRRK